jgi:TRAP-type mannitol/chloroaromatic compound transport system substrate-binding protein
MMIFGHLQRLGGASIMKPKNTERTVSRRGAMGLMAAGAAGAGTLATPHIARAQPRRLTMATTWPAGSPGVGVNAQRCADMIAAMSGGRIEIDFYGAGELVPPFEVFDAVSAGTADLGHGTPYYWQGKDMAVHYFTNMPFGLTAAEHTGWLYFGGGQELWDRVYEPFNLRAFYAGSSGVQAGGWFRREINSLDDLQGLTMRIAGLGGEVMRRLGVNVVLLPPGEIFAAMEAGTVDAAEWVGPWNDIAFGLQRVANHYYLPAFHEFGPALELMINLDVWNSLEEDLQQIVRVAAMGSGTESLGDFTYHNIQSYQDILGMEGIHVHSWPDDIIEAKARAAREVEEEVANASPLAREVHDSYSAYIERAAQYANVMDAEALRMRALAYNL